MSERCGGWTIHNSGCPNLRGITLRGSPRCPRTRQGHPRRRINFRQEEPRSARGRIQTSFAERFRSEDMHRPGMYSDLERAGKGRSRRVPSGYWSSGMWIDPVEIVPGKPELGVLSHLVRVLLERDEIMEGIGAAKGAGVNDAHEHIANVGSMPIPFGTLFANISGASYAGSVLRI